MSDLSRPWQGLSLPPELLHVRSMLSREEVEYLVWLTAEAFEGWGAIVDLGPWLGSSSAALAEGLKRSEKKGRVRAFDLFEWESSYMDSLAKCHLEEGADFLPLFLDETRAYEPWIEPRRQDLFRYTWNEGPIEILFVDAAKTWGLTNAILRGFGSHLVPSRTRVVLQDFRHHTTHWLPLIFESRPDVWREVESVDDGWTVTFAPRKPLFGADGIVADYDERSFSYADASALLKNRIARDPARARHFMLRSLYRLALADGTPADSAEIKKELLSAGASLAQLEEIEDIAYILIARGWKAHQDGDYPTARALAERAASTRAERSPYALSLLGMSLLRLGDLTEARRCIDEVVRRLPHLPAVKLYSAELAVAEARFEIAAQLSFEVLGGGVEDTANFDHAINLLWTAHHGPPTAALEQLAETASETSRPALLAHLSRAYWQSNDPHRAEDTLERAVQLAPSDPVVARWREELAGIRDDG